MDSAKYYNIFIIGTSEDPSENALLTEVLEMQGMTDLGVYTDAFVLYF